MPNRIRLATLDDLDRLLSLDQIASREPTRAAAIRRGIKAGACWVADDGNGLLGYMLLLHKTFFGFDFVELLYVEQRARRHGVGRALIEQAERECTTAKLFTSTNESNAAMRGLLARLGYRRSGVIYNLDKDDPEFIFVKLRVTTPCRCAASAGETRA
jgi:GNAT superfamily N-acetyltransferase